MRIAPENLERFRHLVLADPGLHEELRHAGDLECFVALAVRLGAERDCAFTEADVRAALRECRRSWLEKWI
ncbi:MAG TPA: Nif11-like leader peptide family natural product precursor [Candidatus Baltobacteraceae bacterium]|nr:Nif11-like leader peptide family natural product precursor [Candidatus Baltobacteraceae bacterium]